MAKHKKKNMKMDIKIYILISSSSLYVTPFSERIQTVLMTEAEHSNYFFNHRSLSSEDLHCVMVTWRTHVTNLLENLAKILLDDLITSNKLK